MEFCSICHAGCCRSMNVDVTGYDILKIHNTLGLNLPLFITALRQEGEKYEENRGRLAMFKFADLAPDIYYKLILQSVPTNIFGENSSKCIFLMEWNPQKFGLNEPITARCGIYNLRPLTCRTFPTKLNENLEPVMLDPYTTYQQLKDEYWQNPAYRLCPKAVEEPDYKNFSEQYYKDLYEQHNEMNFFVKVAEKWNQNPEVSDNLLDFLKKEYANRLLPPENKK